MPSQIAQLLLVNIFLLSSPRKKGKTIYHFPVTTLHKQRLLPSERYHLFYALRRHKPDKVHARRSITHSNLLCYLAAVRSCFAIGHSTAGSIGYGILGYACSATHGTLQKE